MISIACWSTMAPGSQLKGWTSQTLWDKNRPWLATKIHQALKFSDFEILRFFSSFPRYFKLFRWGTVPQPRDWQWQDATGIKDGCISGDHDLPVTIQFRFQIPSRPHKMAFPIFSKFVGSWLWLYQSWATSFTEYECLIWIRIVGAERYMMRGWNMMQSSTKLQICFMAPYGTEYFP